MDMREYDYHIRQRSQDLRREREHDHLVALVTANDARPSLFARIRQFSSRLQIERQPQAVPPRSKQKPLCEDCPAAATSY